MSALRVVISSLFVLLRDEEWVSISSILFCIRNSIISGCVLVSLFCALLIESVSTTEAGSLLLFVLPMVISGVGEGEGDGEGDGALSSSLFLMVTVDVSVPA